MTQKDTATLCRFAVKVGSVTSVRRWTDPAYYRRHLKHNRNWQRQKRGRVSAS